MAETDSIVDTEVVEGEVEWIHVFTGSGLEPGLLEEALKGRGIHAVRTPFQDLGAANESAIFGQEGTTFTISVPADEYAARRVEIDEAVAAVAGSLQGNPTAMAEAEEDYDVRGCPNCTLYFHRTYAACPGCGEELVPAVECFEEGQLEPEYVALRHGPDAEVRTVASRLEGGGFRPRVAQPPGWTVSLVELPWGELTDRTADVEAALGSGAAGPSPALG